MAANIKFALHGNSLEAYLHSGSGKTGYPHCPFSYPVPAVVADATAIGGSVLSFDTAGSGDIRGQVWPGFRNASQTGKYSILSRSRFSFTGAPPNRTVIFAVGGLTLALGSSQSLAMLTLSPTGNIEATISKNTSANIFSASSFGAWTPTAGVFYDFVLLWDGTSAAGSIKLYIDGVLFGTKNPGTTSTDGLGLFSQSAIVLGYGMSVSGLRGDSFVNEFVIWDDVIDPTSGGLNLSGSTRTSFVSTTGLVLDPTNSTDPGIANVASPTAYIINGVSLTGSLLSSTPPAATNVRLGTTFINNAVTTTGTLIVPAAADVKHGVVFDASTTGLYRGYDLWGTVTASDVRSGTSYLTDGVTLTGSLSVPAEYTGTASQINYAQIKENIRYILARDNTTTASFDLSSSMDKRVKKVLTINPGLIQIQSSNYPYVTVFVDAKDVKFTNIAVNQKNAKREAVIQLKIVGAVYNTKIPDKVKDKAADECELLMENIEEIIRRDSTFSGTVLWHQPRSVTYHNRPLAGEEAHLRIGIMNLECKLIY